MSSGRPKDRAPEGFLTVREAAELLGISGTAVRNRLERGTLPKNEIVLESGETRVYVPEDAVRRLAVQVPAPATSEHTDEIMLHEDALTKRVLGVLETICQEIQRE